VIIKNKPGLGSIAVFAISVLVSGATVAAEEGTWSKAGEETAEAASAVGDATVNTAEKAWDATKEGSSEAWEATKEGTAEAYDAAKKSVQ
jgi:hypothetical protein